MTHYGSTLRVACRRHEPGPQRRASIFARRLHFLVSSVEQLLPSVLISAVLVLAAQFVFQR